MNTFSNIIAGGAVAAAVLAGGSAMAAQFGPQVAAPQAPMIAVPDFGSRLDGCYKIDSRLYGPYRMSFCLDDGAGTYRVKGGGLDCRGYLDTWSNGPGRVEITLDETRCGRGMKWTADTISCRAPLPGQWDHPQPWNRNAAPGMSFNFNGGNFGGPNGGFNAQVAIPGHPQPQVAVPAPLPVRFGQLSCTYMPAVPGYHPMQVTANRV